MYILLLFNTFILSVTSFTFSYSSKSLAIPHLKVSSLTKQNALYKHGEDEWNMTPFEELPSFTTSLIPTIIDKKDPSNNNNNNNNNNHSKIKSKNKNKRPKKPFTRIPILQYHNKWVCISKPAGITVHRSRSTPKSKPVLTGILKRQLSRKVYPVHRLDHRTSGAMLYSFDSTTTGLLHSSLRSKEEGDVKAYVALCRGDWRDNKNHGDVTSIVVDRELKVDGIMKSAVTEFTLLASFSTPSSSSSPDENQYDPSACSLLLCQPKTGRTHQIRRHASSIGHPILGDTQHGDSKVNRWWREERDLNRLFLHCFELDLPPLASSGNNEEEEEEKKRIHCIAPLTPELQTVLRNEALQELWMEAIMKEPRLELEPVDERGGTFGRNYRESKTKIETMNCK
eukprot:15341158-Ditylum_brightwellii.AAC.1